MSENKVAISGGTSASALWIARTFYENNWDTWTLCSQPEESYSGLKTKRLSFLKNQGDVEFDLRAEDGGLAQWIRMNGPTIWIHHHHHMTNFRLQTYDLPRALAEGVEPLDDIVAALKEVDCKGIIFTGSYFETGEGDQGMSTPYGQSKTTVSEELKKLADQAGIIFSKIILPDAVGPLENEDRFIPQILKYAMTGRDFSFQYPKQIADHLPLETVGSLYHEVANEILDGHGKVLRPSGWVGTQEAWYKEIKKNLLEPLGLHVRVHLNENSTYTDRGRSNSKGENHKIVWEAFWKNYVNFQRTGQPWRTL